LYKPITIFCVVEQTSIKRFDSLINLQLVLSRYKCKLSNKVILNSVKICLEDKNIPKAHIASPITNNPIEENKKLYIIVEEVLNAALPMLGKLTKPALLLPGKLQAIIKAQRIYLKPGEEYNGVWHSEGQYENIVAVVIYYYKVSKQ
jgi:hypothetical protein